MGLLRNRFQFRVRWSPFLLRPHCPRDGLPVEEHLDEDTDNPRVQHLKQTGEQLDLEFNFTCPIYPYTVPAHVLIQYAKLVHNGDLQNNVVDRLFRTYFTKGRSLEKKHLLQIAKDVDFDMGQVERYLDDPENEEEVKRKAHSWRAQGVKAIPFFLINGESAGSGAQEVEEFVRLILQVEDKFPSKVLVTTEACAAGETPL